MNDDFWHAKWASNDIGFHEQQGNRLLDQYLQYLNLRQGQRIFLPLCGKTRDIGKLLERGYRVAGVELSEVAVEQLFEALRLSPVLSKAGELTLYRAKGIDIFLGNIFALNAEQLGKVDAIYDRAALVALPEALRQHYSAQLIQISRGAPQLLISFNYQQSQLEGPPFSLSEPELQQLYAQHYQLERLAAEPVEGDLKGQAAALEEVWLLQKKR